MTAAAVVVEALGTTGGVPQERPGMGGGVTVGAAEGTGTAASGEATGPTAGADFADVALVPLAPVVGVPLSVAGALPRVGGVCTGEGGA